MRISALLPEKASVRGSAFTLIELLVVIAIIGIIAGMVATAAFSARQSSYRAAASSECQALAAAVRQYWVVYGDWPSELKSVSSAGTDLSDRSAGKPLTKDLLKTLMGDKSSKNYGTAFIELDDSKFGDSNDGSVSEALLDPWGNPYYIMLSTTKKSSESLYQTAVYLPMHDSNSL